MENIAEILSNYPIGTILYSPAFGVVKLKKIRPHLAVIVTDEQGEDWEMLYDGRFSLNGECMLFPSKAERDWDWFSKKRVFEGVDSMMFYELECDVIINLSMIVELDKEEGTVELANGVIWHLTDDTITEIIKRIRL